MTSEDLLIELLGRVADQRGEPALVNALELGQWPDEAVGALRKQKLLKKTKAASSAVCHGCEDECVMPVEVIPVASGTPALFVVCDRRDDVNRVPISPQALEQWQIGPTAVIRFIANSLSLRYSGKQLDGRVWEIGIVRGKKRSQMICLRWGGGLTLVGGSGTLPVAEVVRFGEGRYFLDADMIRQLVDNSTTGDTRYTSSNARSEARKLDTEAMYESWQKAYRKLKHDKPGKSGTWYSQRIAKMDIAQGKSSETIRKRMTMKG